LNRKKYRSVLYQAFCLFVGIVVLLPIAYAVLISFMEPPEILRREFHLIPDGLYLGNYIKAITKTTLFRFMYNSLVVAGVSSLVRVITCSMAAFSFAFFQYRGKNLIFMLYLGSMMIPPEILILQNYATTAKLGLINTYPGMMVVFLVSATHVFILRQNFLSYSRSLREASAIDGCTNFMFFCRVLIPSSTSALITVFIASFVGTWNSYVWPLIVTNRDNMRTVQVAITMLNFPDESPHGAIMAAAVLILIPSALVFLIFQKKIKSGIMAGSVKG